MTNIINEKSDKINDNAIGQNYEIVKCLEYFTTRIWAVGVRYGVRVHISQTSPTGQDSSVTPRTWMRRVACTTMKPQCSINSFMIFKV